jgi:5'-nucleotidase
MITRREFLSNTARGLAWLGLAGSAGALVGCAGRTSGRDGARGSGKVTILHTNDVHSRIDPFPAGSGRNAGMAGAVPRARLIEGIWEELRSQGQPRPLLVDAGDVFQGTPYFNEFRGELDFKVMSMLGYDVMTLGNHDFDTGIDRLREITATQASFAIVNANYKFQGTPMEEHVRPYMIHEIALPGGGDRPLKVGIFGLGVKLEGLVTEKLRPGVEYGDPVAAAQQWSRHLRHEQGCDLIVLLSHLGDGGYAGQPGDQHLAREIDEIDLIVGGHTHTFMKAPTRVPHEKRETLVHQVGFAGINLGRVEFVVQDGRIKNTNAWSIPVRAA